MEILSLSQDVFPIVSGQLAEASPTRLVLAISGQGTIGLIEGNNEGG
jgi:hypothetical protein